MRAIYKICRAAEWAEAERSGAFEGSDIDRRDGFIHFSTAEQAAETAAKYFADMADLRLVAVDAGALAAALKWELARGAACSDGPVRSAAIPIADGNVAARKSAGSCR